MNPILLFLYLSSVAITCFLLTESAIPNYSLSFTVIVNSPPFAICLVFIMPGRSSAGRAVSSADEGKRRTTGEIKIRSSLFFKMRHRPLFIELYHA